MVTAEEGIEKLKGNVDTLIVIPNQRLMDVVDRKMTLIEAFKLADSVLSQGVKGISDIITIPGLVNVDFADVKTVMRSAGSALMGIGTGVGENRAQMAARAAISSPLLDVSIEGAKGILLNITGGPDLTMTEVDEAASIISQAADPDANVIFGATIDGKMVDQIGITVIAAGFDQSRAQLAKLASTARSGVINNAGTPRPAVSGVVSEPLAKEPSSQPETPGETQEVTSDREFDVPAFLRQGR